jgi:hypothetical protein
MSRVIAFPSDAAGLDRSASTMQLGLLCRVGSSRAAWWRRTFRSAPRRRHTLARWPSTSSDMGGRFLTRPSLPQRGFWIRSTSTGWKSSRRRRRGPTTPSGTPRPSRRQRELRSCWPSERCRWSRVVAVVRKILAEHLGRDVVLVGHGTAWTLLAVELTGTESVTRVSTSRGGRRRGLLGPRPRQRSRRDAGRGS